jgi:hypothetical protein
MAANWLTTALNAPSANGSLPLDPLDRRSRTASHREHARVGIKAYHAPRLADPSLRSPRQHASATANVEDADSSPYPSGIENGV